MGLTGPRALSRPPPGCPQSAFDRHLALVPFKGQVLNQTSAWWMGCTQDIVPNALVATPHPYVSIMEDCDPLPVEVVVRGYITGTTDTSLWTQYEKGVRNYCGNPLPEGLQKNDKLERSLITPTTKAADHDEPISPEGIIERGLVSEGHWAEVSRAALELFAFGQREAAKRGLLLVDTKYEFGLDAEGSVKLIDEVHTPDSSRYWLADSLEERRAAGLEPENVDKEFLRLWFADHCDPYGDEVLPDAPEELVEELSRRYVALYETITGQAFAPASPEQLTEEAIEKAIAKSIVVE